MLFFRRLNIIVFFLLFVGLCFSQTINPDFLQKSADSTAKEAASLKLPENKAVAFARLGRIYWRIDQNRARQLFRDSIDQLIIAQKEAELDRTFINRSDLVDYGETRKTILDMITAEDEELGFELFQKSRSATVKNVLAGIPNGSMDKLIAQREDIIEQTLISRITNKNPARAISYFRRTPRPNPTYLTLEILQTLQTKDKAVADEIISELIQRVLTAKFIQGSPELGFTGILLSDASQTNRLKVDAQTLRQLAEKVADFITKEVSPNQNYLISVVVKYLPEREAELKEKYIPLRSSIYQTSEINKEASDLLNSKATPDKLLSEADKFPAELRQRIYVKATNQIALSDDIVRAKEILTKNFPKERLPDMFASLNWYLATQLTERGEFDKALELIEQVPENSRFNVLIHLANKMQAQKFEDKQKMLTILATARRLMPQIPITYQEFNQMSDLASAYASIDPETAFSLFELLIKKIGEISEASAIVDSFQKNSNIRNNEYLINSGWIALMNLNPSLYSLTRIDFERTIKIISKIPRLDRRISLQLLVMDIALKI